MSVQFGLLGSVTIHLNGRQVRITSAKQRALLAMLLLRPNRLVPTDRLADDIWGERAPGSAEGLIRTYAWRLRGLLGPEKGRLVGEFGGYRIEVDPVELDAGRFATLAVRGQVLLMSGEYAAAAETLADALAQWRGPLMVDTPLPAGSTAEMGRLCELRLATVEYRIDAELAVGRHRLVIPELVDLVDQHPLREHLTAQLMVALYRGGRRAEALEAYARTARLLRADLGLDPGSTLERLQQEILRDDPALSRADPAATGGDWPAGQQSLAIAYGLKGMRAQRDD